MKGNLIILFLLISSSCFSQDISIYLDSTKLETMSSKYLLDSDYEYLKELKSLFLVTPPDSREVKALLAKYERAEKNGVLFELECDIKGFYELENTSRFSWALKEKYLSANKQTLYLLLRNRMNSITKEGFILPEALFKPQINAIEYEGAEIKINVLQMKSWDYILFESADKKEHYVEFVYGGVGVYTKIHKLSEQDSGKLKSIKPEEIALFIKKYREGG